MNKNLYLILGATVAIVLGLVSHSGASVEIKGALDAANRTRACYPATGDPIHVVDINSSTSQATPLLVKNAVYMLVCDTEMRFKTDTTAPTATADSWPLPPKAVLFFSTPRADDAYMAFLARGATGDCWLQECL